MLRLRTAARWSLSAALVGAGLNHFFNPHIYLPLVPPILPGPGVWNLVAGAAEILGGVGLLVPRLRTAARWGLIAMLIGYLWVHIEMVVNPHRTDLGRATPTWALWARLPLQGVLIAWVWWVGREAPRADREPSVPDA
ncbi:hypothetical protein [Alienimonas sp. DA493]|uniref:DoxX family protein n=1 Tax=Alienimonas sp. DA493 TaxID=3373605 RepID=UPI0037552AED